MTVAITIAGESRTFSTTFGKEFRGEIHLADLIDHHDPATEDCIFHCRQRKLLKGRLTYPKTVKIGSLRYFPSPSSIFVSALSIPMTWRYRS